MTATETIEEGLEASDTLALIAEHRLTLKPSVIQGEWLAFRSLDYNSEATGSTIGDAVRACVARIGA
jgi:hypothetical protein